MRNADEGALPRGSLDPLLTQELRFFIMTVLAMYQTVDFQFLKTELSATDGNLSANLTKLEENGYLTVKKEFVGKKTHSSYTATPKGLASLSAHLETITAIKESLQKGMPKP